MPHIAVVSPVYGCSSVLGELCRRLQISLRTITEDYEIILVNDASPDDAWPVILELANQDTRVKGINLSRNFGQHAAIAAGLDHAQADWIVVIDCDLQDQPEEIPALYFKAQEGFDAVHARRVPRNDGLLRHLFSVAFYRLLGYLTDTVQDASIANFGVYRASVINAVRSLGEYRRYFPVMVRWVGFRQTVQDVPRARRPSGRSSYNIQRLLRLASDVLISFSDKPLRLTVRAGLLIAIFAFLTSLYIVYLAWSGETEVAGWASVMVSVWLFGGLIILAIGMVGLYVGRTFDETKRRPTYIVRDKHGIG